MKKGTLWIALGILLFAAAVAIAAKNLYEDYYAGVQSEAILSEISHIVAIEQPADSSSRHGEPDIPPTEELPPFVLHPSMAMPTAEIDGYRYIGILSFPELELEFPIMEEWDYTRLKIAPCLYSGSIYQHDAVICGHNYLTHFAPLKYVEPGFEAVFTDIDGNTFIYSLVATDIVLPYDVEEMTESSDSWALTVFTCTNGGQTRTTLRFALTDVKYA